MKNGDKAYHLRDALNYFKSALRAIRDSVATQVKTLQVFPRGDMVTYSGEFPHYTDESGAELPPDEQKRIHAQVLADLWIKRDIKANQSSLVDALISEDRDGFTTDDIENVYRDFSDATIGECREYLNDIGGDEPDKNPWKMNRDELAELLADVSIQVYDHESESDLRAAVIANIDDETIDGLDGWRTAATELAQDNPNESYQWFLVSEWLCRHLRDAGEIVIDNGYGQWWGRGCAGQAIAMDGTLQAIARKIIDA